MGKNTQDHPSNSQTLGCLEKLRAGFQVQVYEASERVDGRVRTLREGFSNGLYAEAGAMRIKFGRPRKLSPEQIELALQLIEQSRSVQEVAKTFGVERTTIYRLQAA